MRVSTILKKVALINFILILFVLPNRIWSQTTGSIGGTVIDANDKTPIVGAIIQIEGTSKGAETDANGSYVILNVDFGLYNVVCKYTGYKPSKESGVKVSVDTRTAVNFEMTLSGITTDTLIITAVKKDINVEATSGRDITKEQIDQEGIRGIQQIVGKTSGVIMDEKGTTLNIRGGRTSENMIIVDGVETKNPIDGSSSAYVSNAQIEEIAVLTGGFGAEYGNAMGGIINVTTRSGSSKYSGSAEVESDALTGQWIKTNSQGYNLYNITFGGPLIPSKSLSKVFNFYGGAERFFLLNSYPSWINDQNFPKGIIPNLDQKRWSFNGRLNIDLSAIGMTTAGRNAKIPIQLKGGITYTKNEGRDYVGSFLKNNSQRFPFDNTNDMQAYGRITHQVTSKFFYELQGNYYKSKHEYGDPVFTTNYFLYGDTNAVYGLHSQGSQLSNDSVGVFRKAGAPYPIYHLSDVSYIGGKLDATLALLTKKVGNHEIKFGGEFDYHTLKKMEFFAMPLALNNYANLDSTIDVHSQSFISNQQAILFSGSGAEYKGYGYSFTDQFGNQLIPDDALKARHPLIGDAYIRDKIDFGKDFSFNGGIRVDYFDVNTNVLKSIYNIIGANGTVLAPDVFQKSKPSIIISPRLGFSFPVTDKTIFVAQFGKFVQMPPLDYLYTNLLSLQQFFTTSLQDVTPNPSLQPEKLISYEVGIKQSIGDFLNFNATAYYRETQDQIGAIRVWGSSTVPIGYATYANSDYSVSRGLDLTLNLRRFNRISIDFSYTLLYASGTGSDPNQKFGLVNAGSGYPNFTFPLNYDQRHTGSLDIDYRFGGDNDVPKGFMGKILRQLGINALFSFNSGRPYTSRALPPGAFAQNSGQAFSPKNSVYTNWNFSIDLKVDKTVPIWKTNWNFYVYVTNLLNSQLIEGVWEGTGRPDDDGYLSTQQGSVGYSIPGFVDQYKLRIAFPGNWGPPRQVRFGVKVNF